MRGGAGVSKRRQRGESVWIIGDFGTSWKTRVHLLGKSGGEDGGCDCPWCGDPCCTVWDVRTYADPVHAGAEVLVKGVSECEMFDNPIPAPAPRRLRPIADVPNNVF